MSKTKTSSTQPSLDRALELLEKIAKNGGDMNVSDISKMLGITRITASSMVQSLLQRNYIEKDAVTGKFYIGYKFLELSQAYRYRYPFLYAADQYISDASEKMGLRVNVCVLKPPGVAVILLSKDTSLIPKMILGYVLPAYASASGKLLMAYAQREQVDEWLDNMEFVSYTPYTISSKEKLLDELAQIKLEGIAFESEEMMIQRSCVAAPIRDISGQVIASVSFSGAKDNVDSKMPLITERIRLLANTISSALGYNALQYP